MQILLIFNNGNHSTMEKKSEMRKGRQRCKIASTVSTVAHLDDCCKNRGTDVLQRWRCYWHSDVKANVCNMWPRSLAI